MHLRYSWATLLAPLYVSLIAVAPAIAAKRFIPLDSPPQPIQTVRVGGPRLAGDSTCIVGPNLAPTGSSDYIEPPGDSYYTLLEPAMCTQCVDQELKIEVVHVYLEFRTACQQPIKVSLLGATGPDSCPEPDTTNVLIAPMNYSLDAVGPGTYHFEIAMPSPICLTERAFLGITFDNFGMQCDFKDLWPLLLFHEEGPCEVCKHYNYYPGATELTRDDLCLLGFGGPPIHYSGGNCCLGVPVLPTTWGSLKIRYGSP